MIARGSRSKRAPSPAEAALCIAALATLLCLLVSCSPEDGQDNRDDEADDDDHDDGNLSVNCVNPYCIFEYDDPNVDWPCSDPSTCYEDYLEFISLAEPYGDPIGEDELDQQFQDIMDGRVDVIDDPLPEGTLASRIIDICNIRFLRDGINRRPLRVTTTSREVKDHYVEQSLLFEDPYVGRFKGILLTPKGDGPFAAVIAIHGHGDSAEVFRDQYHGAEFPSAGYAILMLTMRVTGPGPWEDMVTRSMLLNGFTFIGIRSYETLLGLKYLRYLPQIDDDRIGLIGHSGGSVASNLTVRVEPGFGAYVSDEAGVYFNYDEQTGWFLDETAPDLYPYHGLINDFETCSMPIMTVPYAYSSGMDVIFDFFDEHIGP